MDRRIKNHVGGVFAGAAEPIQYLMGNQIGLRLKFSRPFDLASLFEQSGNHYANDALFDLTNRYGVLIMENAFVSAPTEFGISGPPLLSVAKSVKQDPFHRDEIPQYQGDCITILDNPKDKGRSMPTLYASVGAVRRAMARLNRGAYSHDVNDALDSMMKKGYSFSLVGEEARASAIVHREVPDFMETLVPLVSRNERYAKSWTPGVMEVVCHSNMEGRIVHGRTGGPKEDHGIKPYYLTPA